MPKTWFVFNTLDFSSIQALQQKNKDQLKNGTDLCYEMLFNETWPAPSTWDTKKVFLSITVEKLRKMNKRGPTQNCPRLKMSTQPHLQAKGFLRQRARQTCWDQGLFKIRLGPSGALFGTLCLNFFSTPIEKERQMKLYDFNECKGDTNFIKN